MELTLKLDASEIVEAEKRGVLMQIIELSTVGGPRVIQSSDRVIQPAGEMIDKIPENFVPDAPMEAPREAPKVETLQTAPEPEKAVPTSAPEYTQDDLGKAAVALMDKGVIDSPQLVAILQEFGVTGIPALTGDQKAAFALRLRELGAEI